MNEETARKLGGLASLVKGKRVGVLGGTFNPIHLDHVKIGLLAAKQLKLDVVIIFPNFHNPLKGAPKMLKSQEDKQAGTPIVKGNELPQKRAPIHVPTVKEVLGLIASKTYSLDESVLSLYDRHRLEMIKLAIVDHNCLQVSAFEIINKVKFTIETLCIISQLQESTKNDLYWIIGSDVVASFKLFDNVSMMCETNEIGVVQRKPATQGEIRELLLAAPGMSKEAAIRTSEHWVARDDQAEELISSTAIRNAIAEKRDGPILKKYLNSKAYSYIQKHNLYS
eukprot:TRINITY_DN18107_c0_g1_i1.p1 TRINITY_DN18107_c0_g1~~TRINITY_DN18107_c0_g1_i1.p1  ORF type:complete len:290 (+),score=45.99 TRINITY_DN18107_c0_g1_i1:30-872(+)